MIYAECEYERKVNALKYPNIEAERARHGFTKSDLAEKLGITPKTYQNWQDSKTEIPCSKIIAMSYMFDVASDYLLGIERHIS